MMLLYPAVTVLICMGIYSVLTRSNMIKIVVGISIVESSIILLLGAMAYVPEGAAPVLDKNYETVVDPLPQALGLTAIVINASTTAIMLALVIKLYNRYNTLNIHEIRRLRG